MPGLCWKGPPLAAWSPQRPLPPGPHRKVFLHQEFPPVAESASYAERHVYGDPRASCFHARHALESLVKRVYKVDKALKPPRVQNLDGYLNEPTFIETVPEAVRQKAEFVRQAGNVAVHGKKTPTPEAALEVVRELYHIAYWAGRTYLRKGAEDLKGKTFDETLVPKVGPDSKPASIEELEAMRAERDAAEEARRAGEKAANEAARVAAKAIARVEHLAKDAMQLAELTNLAVIEAATTIEKRLSGKASSSKAPRQNPQ